MINLVFGLWSEKLKLNTFLNVKSPEIIEMFTKRYSVVESHKRQQFYGVFLQFFGNFSCAYENNLKNRNIYELFVIEKST